MGATNVGFTLDGKKSKKEVIDYFQKAREKALYMYGHDSYNGTISTIPDVRITDEVFETKSEAEEYCLDNAEKWEYAIACKYKNKEGNLMWLVEGWAAE